MKRALARRIGYPALLCGIVGVGAYCAALAQDAPQDPASISKRRGGAGVEVAPDFHAVTRTAVDALTTKQQVIAHNLANLGTVGFKRRRAILTEGDYLVHVLPGVMDDTSSLTAVGISIGQGVSVQCVQADFGQGPLSATNRALDLAIDGPGFFQLASPDGQLVYTRAGAFSLNDQGMVVTSSARIGRPLQPQLAVPTDTVELTITRDGTVSIVQASSSKVSQIGKIQLATFQNLDGLQPLGEGLYAETAASGPVLLREPCTDGMGAIRQKMLEMSNVDSALEIAELKRTAAEIDANRVVLQSFPSADSVRSVEPAQGETAARTHSTAPK